MAILFAIAALTCCSVAMGVSAGLVAATGGSIRLRDAPSGISARFLASSERLGHWFPVVRLSNVRGVRPLLRRVSGMLAERGTILSDLGCLAAILMASAVAGLTLSFLGGSVLAFPIGAGVVVGAVARRVASFEREKRDLFSQEMPQALRALSSALSAGKSLPQAIEYVGGNTPEPLGSIFLKASFQIRGGVGIGDAVSRMCQEIDVPGAALLGTAMSVSQRTGSPLGSLFQKAGDMIEQSVSLRRELEVKTSQARLSAKIVSTLPLVLACVLTLISPDYRAGLVTSAGFGCLAVSALLDILSARIMGSIMRGSIG